ncbi:MAG: hypothetical protein V1915_02125 [Candidatus Bathyarchaeota archaeon]
MKTEDQRCELGLTVFLDKYLHFGPFRANWAFQICPTAILGYSMGAKEIG